MVKQLFMLVFLGMVFGIAPAAQAQRGGTENKEAKGVPVEYAGDWVCQTYVPGYNILPPHADLSQPQTNKMNTPSTVRILKFSLRTDGTYEALDAKGRYAFNPATNAVTWLDGPPVKAFTKTRLGRRENGAPKMGLVLNKRHYGCFMSKPRR